MSDAFEFMARWAQPAVSPPTGDVMAELEDWLQEEAQEIADCELGLQIVRSLRRLGLLP